MDPLRPEFQGVNQTHVGARGDQETFGRGLLSHPQELPLLRLLAAGTQGTDSLSWKEYLPPPTHCNSYSEKDLAQAKNRNK